MKNYILILTLLITSCDQSSKKTSYEEVKSDRGVDNKSNFHKLFVKEHDELITSYKTNLKKLQEIEGGAQERRQLNKELAGQYAGIAFTYEPLGKSAENFISLVGEPDIVRKSEKGFETAEWAFDHGYYIWSSVIAIKDGIVIDVGGLANPDSIELIEQ